MAVIERPVAKPRPIYLNLLRIRQPVPAIVSVLHRISGALLFLVGIPFILWLAQHALGSEQGWEATRSALGHPLVKLVLLALAWAYLHHLLAGIRHVVQDLHIGMQLKSARASAASVLVVSLLVTLGVAIRLW
ncbi:MAG: succinate dehydrogenase, cytochrome b556 subunit [Burkholderiales bacterium]|nr:succinate dehydrogenase, cytochrome b556 subunit [Burkholderiales bacterium]